MSDEALNKAYQEQGGMTQDQFVEEIGNRPCPNEIKGSGTEPNSGTLNGQPNK